MKKTKSEEQFEAYLRQRKTPFKFEPFGHGGSKPDYLFDKSDCSILVEVEGIELTEFNRTIMKTPPNQAGSCDLESTLRKIRQRIIDGAVQLKPYTAEVDYCVVILGKHASFDIPHDMLINAVVGSPVFTMPILRNLEPQQINRFGPHCRTGHLFNQKQGKTHSSLPITMWQL